LRALFETFGALIRFSRQQGVSERRCKMRKLVLLSLIATSLAPVAAGAQTRHEVWRDRQEVRQDRQELRQDRRELRQDRRDVRHDWRNRRIA